MTHVAPRLRRYLNGLQVPFDVSVHARTNNTGETAKVAHVRGDVLAKGVLLADDDGPVLAVLPSTCHVAVDRLNQALGRRLTLVDEQRLGEWFDDCAIGAVPIAGRAYGVDVIVDDSLDRAEDVYFEAGDHRHLVHIDSAGFETLMATSKRGMFSVHD